jgi:hypothetical protein
MIIYKMKIIIRVLKPIINELFIIFLFILLINILFRNGENIIKSDGIGYYDYLPSLFIHHDLVRKDIPVSKDSVLYSRISSLRYKAYGEYKIDKYACGTAVLQLPFFIFPFLTTDLEGNNNDGYQPPFQKAVLYSAIFYLFLGIFFLKKLLELYNIKKSVTIFSQVLLVFATAVANYANFDAGFSHVYSLFAITAFLYFVKSFFRDRNLNHFIFACLFFGLIIILRQINILIILFIPFISGSLTSLKKGVTHLLQNPGILLGGIILISAVFFIQSLAWYLQVGKFFVYSYQGEGFDFLHPHFIDILFSYTKGLFIYTPILFITLSGLIWFVFKRQYFLVLTWLSFFIVLTYVLSSWNPWDYAASYGSRPYIDYYTVFFIPFAVMLDEIPKRMKTAIIFISVLTIPVNIIQAYQYEKYILHWSDMNKEKYWKVFLKTDKKYRGLLWKKSIDPNNFVTVADFVIGDINTSKNTDTVIFNANSLKIPDFKHVRIIQVLIGNDYRKENDSEIILSITDTSNSNIYYNRPLYLFRYLEKQNNEWQTGLFNYEINPFADQEEKNIRLKIISVNQNNKLKNVEIKLLKYR